MSIRAAALAAAWVLIAFASPAKASSQQGEWSEWRVIYGDDEAGLDVSLRWGSFEYDGGMHSVHARFRKRGLGDEKFEVTIECLHADGKTQNWWMLADVPPGEVVTSGGWFSICADLGRVRVKKVEPPASPSGGAGMPGTGVGTLTFEGKKPPPPDRTQALTKELEALRRQQEELKKRQEEHRRQQEQRRQQEARERADRQAAQQAEEARRRAQAEATARAEAEHRYRAHVVAAERYDARAQAALRTGRGDAVQVQLQAELARIQAAGARGRPATAQEMLAEQQAGQARIQQTMQAGAEGLQRIFDEQAARDARREALEEAEAAHRARAEDDRAARRAVAADARARAEAAREGSRDQAALRPTGPATALLLPVYDATGAAPSARLSRISAVLASDAGGDLRVLGPAGSACADATCALAAGGAIGAEKVLWTALSGAGARCVLAAALYDVSAFTVQRARSAEVACTDEALEAGAREIARGLTAGLAEGGP